MTKIIEPILPDSFDGLPNEPTESIPNPEQELTFNPEKMRSGPMPADFSIEKFCDLKRMGEFLYRSQDVNEQTYEEMVDFLGTRAARLVLRAKACDGDVRAIDLYLKVADEAKKRRTKPAKAPERNVTVTDQFKPGSRPKADKGE
jgi:hypothetical protein